MEQLTWLNKKVNSLNTAKHNDKKHSVTLMINNVYMYLCAGFDLTFCDSYFTIFVKFLMNHILAKGTYFMNHIGLTKQNYCSKYQILGHHYSFKNILILKPAVSTKLLGIAIISKAFLSMFSSSIIHSFFE